MQRDVAEVEEEPIHSLADLASAGRARRRKPNALKWRIVKFLGGSGDPERLFSVQEIARAVGSKDNDVVQYALQDLRAKSRLLDRPIDGKWRLNEDGRREAATLP